MVFTEGLEIYRRISKPTPYCASFILFIFATVFFFSTAYCTDSAFPDSKMIDIPTESSRKKKKTNVFFSPEGGMEDFEWMAKRTQCYVKLKILSKSV